jgi:hypothetical protein
MSVRRLSSSASAFRAVGGAVYVWAASICILSLGACAEGDSPEPTYQAQENTTVETVNTLTPDEQAEGWTLLWNGNDFSGWRGVGSDSIPSAHWQIVDGTIRKVPSSQVPVQADGRPAGGGDLMTERTYEDFELSLDFKLAPGANSGIKYNVDEELSTSHSRRAALGFEYQILDDSLHPDAKAGVGGNRTLGALYDMMPPNASKQANPPGEWNHARILRQDDRVEHWLNGQKILEYVIGSPEFDSLLAASKYVSIQGFAENRPGHIVLQDHSDEVFFRNIKIRDLATAL